MIQPISMIQPNENPSDLKPKHDKVSGIVRPYSYASYVRQKHTPGRKKERKAIIKHNETKVVSGFVKTRFISSKGLDIHLRVYEM
jgi:hypothetical protein